MMVPLARGAGERLKFVSMLNSRKSNCCKDSIIQDGATAPIQHVVPSELCLRITSYGMKDERLGMSSSLARWGHTEPTCSCSVYGWPGRLHDELARAGIGSYSQNIDRHPGLPSGVARFRRDRPLLNLKPIR